MSNSAIPSLTVAENIFKDLVWDPLLMMGETALFVAVPALDWPILGTIDRAILGEVSDWIFHQIVLIIDVTVIKFVNAEHQAAFDTAQEKLFVVATDYGPTSTQFLEARDAAAKALAQFVRPVVG